MRVLAIDTALAACAAAVLDTDHGVVASETLPMVRGHAESLIPLTACLADKDWRDRPSLIAAAEISTCAALLSI
jgi:tRNA A37 threonylcarbamoyladenosine modification protein TsaB